MNNRERKEQTIITSTWWRKTLTGSQETPLNNKPNVNGLNSSNTRLGDWNGKKSNYFLLRLAE
jgi:hypothetical protein